MFSKSTPLRLAAAAAVLAALCGFHLGCGASGAGEAGTGIRVIVLGFDGMDYTMTREFMAKGVMPNFVRLAQQGEFQSLATSVPPLSPVAWSNFITGMDAGGHGIFDFLHRDPETIIPYNSISTAESKEPTKLWNCWQKPGAGELELLRRGKAFWEELEDHGVETTVLRMPANFPPTGGAAHELSGMGTPDLLGGYGTFSFYTSELFAFGGQEVSGGEIHEAWPEEGVVKATMYGPPNPFWSDKDPCKQKKLELEFEVFLDEQEDVAKLVVGDEQRVLQVGEWSDWVPLSFEMIPTQSIPGMVRFYLRQVRPEFELYASPINFDPMAPALPVSTPGDYAAELAEAAGRFYTQGMPEDTKAYTEGVFTADDFLSQARIAGGEIREQYKLVLDEFNKSRTADRLLFYYFGSVDQVSHVMFRPTDPEHPAYDADLDQAYEDVVESLYRDADAVVGYTLDHLEEGERLVVMSDHGFASWRRAFHLNAWLRDHGYLKVKNPNLRKEPSLFFNVDWTGTRAYGAGFNGLYVNQLGREKNGIVDEPARDALLDEIAAKLLATIDPATGEPAITKVYRREEIYQDRGELELGPDLVIGYARGTRIANPSILGEMAAEVFSDNTEAWSGDHGMDHETVPGILLTDRPLKKPATSLKNLAASILAEYGIDEFPVRDKADRG